MRHPHIAPIAIANGLWTHRNLLASLVRRDVAGRYRGSAAGMLWSLLHPLLMLTIYTFVFGVVFKARWGDGGGTIAEFALALFAGLMAFNLFAECVNRAPGLILTNANYVKKVVFPLEILPWVPLGSALFHFAASLAVWIAFHGAVSGMPRMSLLALPLVLSPLVLVTMGVSWVLASLGVYLRDVSQVVAIATTALMFLSPIFYPVSAIPEEFQPLLTLNPLTIAIEQVRDVMLAGRVPSPARLAAQLGISAALAWLGFVWFQKTRKGFADVV